MRGGDFSHPRDLWFLVFNEDGILVDEVDGNPIKSDRLNTNPILIFNHQMVLVGNIDSPEMLVWKSLVTNKIIRVPTSINPDFFAYAPQGGIYPRADQVVFKVGGADTVYVFNPLTGEVVREAVIYTEKHRFDREAIEKARHTERSGRFERVREASTGAYSIRLVGESDKYYLLFVTIHGENSEEKLLTVDKSSGGSQFITLVNDFSGDNLIDIDCIRFYNNRFLIIHQPSESADENDALFYCYLKQPGS